MIALAARRTWLVAAVAAGLAFPAAAQTLPEAIQQAYSANPTLRASRAGLSAVDERLVQARAGYGPQIAGTLGEASGVVTGPKIVGSSSAAGIAGSLTINQPLFTGGRIRAAISVAEAEISQQHEVLRRTNQEVLGGVIGAFLAVRRDEQLLAAYRDNLKALERQLRQTRAEFAVRRTTQTDVDQAQGRAELARADMAQAGAQLEISRSLYVQLVGSVPGSLAPEPDLGVFSTVNAALDSADAQNAQLQAARFAEAAGRARLTQAEAAFRPSVNAQLSVARSPIDSSGALFIGETAVSAGLTLSQPLYTSGLVRSSIRQARADVEVLSAQVEAARLVAIQQVSQAWSRVVAARLSLAADEVRVTATEAAFYGVRQEHPFDLRSSLDLLNAAQELNNAQARLLSDRYAEYMDRVDLLIATGALGPQTFAEISPDETAADHLKALRRSGPTPWTPIIQALDSVGAPPPAPVAHLHAGEMVHASLNDLPPAPPPAAMLRPLRTATSIMDAGVTASQTLPAEPVVKPR